MTSVPREANPRLRNRLPLVVAATVVGLLTIASSAAVASPARSAAASRPAPLPRPHEGRSIEDFAPDQAQFFCRSHVEPGVKAFERRVLAHYRVSHSDGDMRSCDVSGSSEHKDGRAWDWGVDHRIKSQRAAGKSMLRWLFATDSHGNTDAMFRRLGLMYVIWNKRIWGAWSQHWEPYSCSGPTLCHVNHMHFSFGWAGAEKKTSYWTHKVSPVVEPPLPYFGQPGRHRVLTVHPSEPAYAMWLFHGHAQYRATASGVWHQAGGGGKADAVCSKTPHGWAPSRRGGLRIAGDQLDSWDEHWQPVHDSGNGCNTKTHTYRLSLTPSRATTVSGELSDGSTSAGSGAVHLRIGRLS
jgi:hypothetical protein